MTGCIPPPPLHWWNLPCAGAYADAALFGQVLYALTSKDVTCARCAIEIARRERAAEEPTP